MSYLIALILGASLSMIIWNIYQIVAAVPHEDFDERLDWVATDARFVRCGG